MAARVPGSGADYSAFYHRFQAENLPPGQNSYQVLQRPDIPRKTGLFYAAQLAEVTQGSWSVAEEASPVLRLGQRTCQQD
jgi:hypothetical protein